MMATFCHVAFLLTIYVGTTLAGGSHRAPFFKFHKNVTSRSEVDCANECYQERRCNAARLFEGRTCMLSYDELGCTLGGDPNAFRYIDTERIMHCFICKRPEEKAGVKSVARSSSTRIISSNSRTRSTQGGAFRQARNRNANSGGGSSKSRFTTRRSTTRRTTTTSRPTTRTTPTFSHVPIIPIDESSPVEDKRVNDFSQIEQFLSQNPSFGGDALKEVQRSARRQEPISNANIPINKPKVPVTSQNTAQGTIVASRKVITSGPKVETQTERTEIGTQPTRESVTTTIKTTTTTTTTTEASKEPENVIETSTSTQQIPETDIDIDSIDVFNPRGDRELSEPNSALFYVEDDGQEEQKWVARKVNGQFPEERLAEIQKLARLAPVGQRFIDAQTQNQGGLIERSGRSRIFASEIGRKLAQIDSSAEAKSILDGLKNAPKTTLTESFKRHIERLAKHEVGDNFSAIQKFLALNPRLAGKLRSEAVQQALNPAILSISGFSAISGDGSSQQNPVTNSPITKTASIVPDNSESARNRRILKQLAETQRNLTLAQSQSLKSATEDQGTDVQIILDLLFQQKPSDLSINEQKFERSGIVGVGGSSLIRQSRRQQSTQTNFPSDNIQTAVKAISVDKSLLPNGCLRNRATPCMFDIGRECKMGKDAATNCPVCACPHSWLGVRV